MAVSSRGPRSSGHARLSRKTWVSFVTLQSRVEDDFAGLSLGSRLAHQPRCTLRTRQPFEAIPAWQASVAFGPWLSRETDLSWGALWPGRPSESFCVTEEAAVSFLAFLSNFACQSRLSWGPGRPLVAWWSWLTLHNAICVAWLPRGSGEAGGAREPIASSGSRHRRAWRSSVTLFSSFAREARSTDLPWDGEAWRAWLALNSRVTFGARLPSQPGGAWVTSFPFFSQRSGANNSSWGARRARFAFVPLGARPAWEPRVARVARKARTAPLSLFTIFSRFPSRPRLSRLAFLSNSWDSLKSRFTFLTLFSRRSEVPFLFHLRLPGDPGRPTDPLLPLVTFRPLKTRAHLPLFTWRARGAWGTWWSDISWGAHGSLGPRQSWSTRHPWESRKSSLPFQQHPRHTAKYFTWVPLHSRGPWWSRMPNDPRQARWPHRSSLALCAVAPGDPRRAWGTILARDTRKSWVPRVPGCSWRSPCPFCARKPWFSSVTLQSWGSVRPLGSLHPGKPNDTLQAGEASLSLLSFHSMAVTFSTTTGAIAPALGGGPTALLVEQKGGGQQQQPEAEPGPHGGGARGRRRARRAAGTSGPGEHGAPSRARRLRAET